MPTVYLDMDGVLADFDSRAREIISATDTEHHQAQQQGRWPDHQWKKLLEYPNFYRDLPKMPAADQLVEVARQFLTLPDWQIRILTAIPRGNDMPEAFHDKVLWIQEHYPDLRVHFGPYSHDKKHHCCSPEDILVDDRRSNCEEWPGRAVRVYADRYSEAVGALDQLFLDENSRYLFD